MSVEPTLAPRSARLRLTRAERRQAILGAARQEFARVGYHGTSTARIARSANCSEPMLYKHFSSKQELFAVVLEEASAAIERAFDEMLAAPGNLMERLERFVPRVMGDPQYVEMLMLRKLAVTIAHEPSVRESLVAINRRHVDRTRAGVERGIAQGDVRPDVDGDYVAWVWSGLMLAACLREVIEEGGFASMTPHVLAFLRGLQA